MHQVPFPELVVTAVQTKTRQGDLAATLYAYSGAEMMYDPQLDSFRFPGYRRTVALQIPTEQRQGSATITDIYSYATPDTPYQPSPGQPALTADQRYALRMRIGKTKDVTTLSGDLGSDPVALARGSALVTTARTSVTHYEWDAKITATSTDPGPEPDLCVSRTYASPVGTDARVLTAVSSLAVTDCGTAVFSKRSSEYDHLPMGNVAAGYSTAQITERHSDTGALLSTISASAQHSIPVNRCMNVKTYLLFGIEGDDLHGARTRLERAIGIKMDLHESGYRCGEYYRLGDVGGEHLILQKNFDDVEDEWTEPACREYGLLFYANETDRADFFCSALAGCRHRKAGLESRGVVARDGVHRSPPVPVACSPLCQGSC